MSANYSLVLLLQQSFDCEWVEEVGLLVVIVLVMRASSQLGSLSTRTILGPETGKTVHLGWIVLNGDLGDKWPLW